eukprot:2611375-Pleurochrysis_carterae.AAC.1
MVSLRPPPGARASLPAPPSFLRAFRRFSPSSHRIADHIEACGVDLEYAVRVSAALCEACAAACVGG